ncbi:hypothetical protein ACFLS1_04850 [Verrucomicrobiota bacterium]
MKVGKLLLWTFLLTLILWGVLSWPLPRYASSGIPALHHNIAKEAPRLMIPGDHLQFLYHLWLAKDTFEGNTKLFYNSYEFNTGNEEERYEPSMRYYLPFSLIFSITSLNGNQAFGWNATSFVSLWISLVFSWLLVRRYTKSISIAILASAITLAIPYRWIALMGGSPTGLAMMWAPLIFYGLDVMVRDKKAWGAVLAGASLFLAGWCDPHVVFFAGLAAPFWCILTRLFNSDKFWPDKPEMLKLTKAAAPLIVFAVLIIIQAHGIKSGLKDTTISREKHRPIHEIAINSPRLSGSVKPAYHEVEGRIYVGAFLLILLSAAITCMFLRRKEIPVRILITAALLYLAVISIIVLATGTNNPGRIKAWEFLINLIPPYGKIRQPTKIFIILPPILTVLTCIVLPYLLEAISIKKKQPIVCFVIGIALLADYGARINPTICLLDKKEHAYKAIDEDAKNNNLPSHILALPLWPGNSHWTSLNQYYMSLYRMRMINGYRPTRREKYFEDVYLRFESFNSGGYSDNQLENLLGRGINYIVLHENAFPEKVSPFSVSHTLHQLLLHPRIKLLSQDGPVWAFKIVNAQQGTHKNMPDWSKHSSARLWQAENSCTNAAIQISPDTSANKYAVLPGKSAIAASSPYSITYFPKLCYITRLRGKGRVCSRILIEGQIISKKELSVKSDKEWTWHKISIPNFSGYKTIQLEIQPKDDPIDIDLIIMATEDWNFFKKNKNIVIPAPTFFHAGYTDLNTDEVVFNPDTEPAEGVSFYGPKLPVPAGRYKIYINYQTDAVDGTVLGKISSRYPYGKVSPTQIIAGQPAMFSYEQDCNLRLAIDMSYSRKASLRIKDITIEPVSSE